MTGFALILWGLMSADDGAAPDVRAVSVYSLTEQLAPKDDSRGLHAILDIGESQRYLLDPLGLLPRVIMVDNVPTREFCGEIGTMLSRVTVTALLTSRGDPLVLVESRFEGSPSLDGVVRYREQMQGHRDAITVAGAAFVDWLGGRLGMPAGYRLGYGHTMIFAEGAFAAELLEASRRCRPPFTPCSWMTDSSIGTTAAGSSQASVPRRI
ncbi:hypothetical protein [Streptacidiphilus carbonis]|uniref:hypothetical protein n=1 Tax=Streptacidiphilus carbonis TaxID=105422 RepID=UPI00069331DE|nr:hypothetical protein [Streptacidiphilus carbonis]